MPSTKSSTAQDKVAALLDGAIDQFCSGDGSVPERVIKYYPPNGATQAGGVKLPEGTPFVIRNMGTTSLRLFAPFDFVVWWFDPKATGSIAELHVDLGVPPRIVVYDDYIKARPHLGKGRALEQGHPLADIPHEHFVECSGKRVKVVVNEIVWQGDFVGKIGKLALSVEPR